MDKKTKYSFEEPSIAQFGRRLKEAMAGESNNSFAKKCGLSETVIRKYLSGESYPNIDKLPAIARACEKSIEWLVTGKNDNEANNEQLSCNEETNEDLSEKNVNLLTNLFKYMPVEQKNRVLKLALAAVTELVETPESSGYQLSQSSINTAKILDKLTAEQRREILRRYEIDEGDSIDEEGSKDKINQTAPQHKKKAS